MCLFTEFYLWTKLSERQLELCINKHHSRNWHSCCVYASLYKHNNFYLCRNRIKFWKHIYSTCTGLWNCQIAAESKYTISDRQNWYKGDGQPCMVLLLKLKVSLHSLSKKMRAAEWMSEWVSELASQNVNCFLVNTVWTSTENYA